MRTDGVKIFFDLLSLASTLATGVHFIGMYEMVYNISGMRIFCSVETSRLVYGVKITEIVYFSFLHDMIRKIAW